MQARFLFNNENSLEIIYKSYNYFDQLQKKCLKKPQFDVKCKYNQWV